KVIYRSIPKSMRMEWHANIVKQLKSPSFKRLEDRHLLMAVHAEKSGNELLTHIYSKWAARDENAASRYKSGIAFSRVAARAAKSVGDLKNRERHVIRAKLFEIKGLLIMGKYAHVKRHLDVLLDKKQVLKKTGCLEQVLSFHALYCWIRGDLQ